MTETVERCAVCAGACAVAGSGASVPALARMDAADALETYGAALTDAARAALTGTVAVCDGCVALAARWAIADGRPAVGYVNADGTAITSWGGAHVARIVRSSRLRSTFGGDGLAWSAELPSGAKCYGRNGGRGMVTNIRSAVR